MTIAPPRPLRREPGRRRAVVARRVPERDRPASPGGHEHQGVHRVEREREKLADGEVPGRDGRRRPGAPPQSQSLTDASADAVARSPAAVSEKQTADAAAPCARSDQSGAAAARTSNATTPPVSSPATSVVATNGSHATCSTRPPAANVAPAVARRASRTARRPSWPPVARQAGSAGCHATCDGSPRASTPRPTTLESAPAPRARHAVAVVRPRHRTRACVQIPELDGAVRGAGGEDRRRVASPRDGQHGVAVRARRRPRRLPPGGRGRVAAQARDGRRGLHDVQIPHVDARLHRPDRDAGARRAVLQERERQRERLQSNVVVHVEAPLLVVVHVHFYAREVVLGAARQEHGVRRADRVVLRVAVRGAPLRGPRLRRAGPAGTAQTALIICLVLNHKSWPSSLLGVARRSS